MPKRKRKMFTRPRKLYESKRIADENVLVKKYGLKNKREIWKANFAVEKIRKIAKDLITAPEEKKQKFIEKQKARGFAVNSIADILGLTNEDYLKRRLQSILVKKGLVTTPKQARQFIVHKHVTIFGNKINIPSHLTTVEEEANVELKLVRPIKKEELKSEEKAFLEEIKNPKADGMEIVGEESEEE